MQNETHYISVNLNSYQQIAEIMDFGYPQNLSPEILKLYITQEGVRSPFSSKVRCFFFFCSFPFVSTASYSVNNEDLMHLIEKRKLEIR